MTDNEIENIKLILLQDRTNYKNTISGICKKYKDILNLETVQIELFTFRQEIVEIRSKISNSLKECIHDTNYKKNDKIKIYNNDDIRYSKAEIEIMMEHTLSDHYKMKNIYTVHIEYLDETLKTIDFMIYGIKEKMNIKNYLG